MPSVDGFVVLISKYLIVWLRGGFQSDERNAHVESRVSPGKATNSRAPSSGQSPLCQVRKGRLRGIGSPTACRSLGLHLQGGSCGKAVGARGRSSSRRDRKGHPGELRVLPTSF